VEQPDGELSQLKAPFSGQSSMACSAAAVAVNCIHGFIRKNIQYRDISQVTSMDNYLTIGKALSGRCDEIPVRAGQVGIGKYACLDCICHSFFLRFTQKD
jgi:hypothetical protein